MATSDRATGRMIDAFLPSLLIGETHFHFGNVDGAVAEAVRRVAEEGYYNSVEIPFLRSKEDRRKIASSTIAAGIAVTTWLSGQLYELELNLSSPRGQLRRKSVAVAKDYLNQAAEYNAQRFGILSGPDPGPELRNDAMKSLDESISELCEFARRIGSIGILLEPLDRGAHKNGLVGPTSVFVPFVRGLRERHPNISIGWDTAHIALCGEDWGASLEASRDIIDGIHLSNAVLDKSDEEYGDHHMRIGPPGFLTIRTIASMFRRAVQIGLFYGRRPQVAVEVRSLSNDDPWRTESHCRDVLESAWALVKDEPPCE